MRFEFIKNKNETTINIDLSIMPKCFFGLNHNWDKWREPFVAYDRFWKQTRVCKACGKVIVRDLDSLYSDRLE